MLQPDERPNERRDGEGAEQAVQKGLSSLIAKCCQWVAVKHEPRSSQGTGGVTGC